MTGSIAFEQGLDGREIGVLLILVLIAVGSKLGAGWFVPVKGSSRAAIGSGLVPRGEVGLVFAQVGLSSLALTQGQYSILTLVLVVTTLAGPVLLRRFAEPPPQELPGGRPSA